jgi:cell division protein FtsI/penicillin-binding protein 2
MVYREDFFRNPKPRTGAKMKTPHLARYTFLAILLWTAGLLVIAQMFRVQTSASAQAVLKDTKTNDGYYKVIYPARGIIFDRNGNMLAGNELVYEVGVNLEVSYDPKMIASTLASAIGSDYAGIIKLFNDPITPSLKYLVLADYVTIDQVNKLKQLQIDAANAAVTSKDKNQPTLSALTWTPHLRRTYPEGSLASNILGFYPYRAGNSSVGTFGIEEKYNVRLTGTPQTVYMSNNPFLVQPMPQIPPGDSLVLTIDRAIQAATEDILDKAVKSAGASSGTIIVMDPKTGEILAMANSERMDLNQYWNYADIYQNATDFNRPVMTTYEPGSVFKVITMASALDAGAVVPDTIFNDTGVIEIGGSYIYNWDGGAYGNQTMTGCMQHSLNVCLTWVAEQLGPTRFYNYLRAFGIGHLTGVDLAGEAYYPLHVPGDNQWYDVDLGTNSFGQGVAVTPIQMVMAISAVANNEGKMMAPHLVKAIIENGRQYNIPPAVAGNPISAATAQTLTAMLARSLEGESQITLMPGYRVAGKTGTAEIPTPTGYSSSLTNASFVGWGPIDDPRFLVYVWLEKPQSSQWGSVVAAPVFNDVLKKLVVLMDIPPDAVRQQLAAKP